MTLRRVAGLLLVVGFLLGAVGLAAEPSRRKPAWHPRAKLRPGEPLVLVVVGTKEVSFYQAGLDGLPNWTVTCEVGPEQHPTPRGIFRVESRGPVSPWRRVTLTASL